MPSVAWPPAKETHSKGLVVNQRPHVCVTCSVYALCLLQLLYSKFTEYLEDFHVWASAYSAPPCNGLLRTQRLTVAFALLCTHACLTALVTATRWKQVGGTGFSLKWLPSPNLIM